MRRAALREETEAIMYCVPTKNARYPGRRRSGTSISAYAYAGNA
jgi:hypothetical protein